MCKVFDLKLCNQGRFLKNFMDLYESLLLFVRSSRMGSWELHLQSLDNFVKYFFAHDQLNYARMTPLYLANMEDLKTSDNNTWKYLEENFSICKTSIPFSAIGADHAMEQENKSLKVRGGVTGLTQNQSALTRFCLISSIISSLSKEFTASNGIATQKHYQLNGSTSRRIRENVMKMCEVMKSFSISFLPNDCVFNVMTKAVLPDDKSMELLEHKDIGQNLYKKFISERLNGDGSVWSKLKKRKLATFRNQTKSINKKVGEKIINLKEEKTLLSRFLIAARKRPELDLKFSLGNFEFSVVPKSLFTTDGQLLHSTDKSKVLHHIEDMANASTKVCELITTIEETYKVIIIDGMAAVNQVVKTKDMKTCKVCDR